MSTYMLNSTSVLHSLPSSLALALSFSLLVPYAWAEEKDDHIRYTSRICPLTESLTMIDTNNYYKNGLVYSVLGIILSSFRLPAKPAI